MILLAIILMIIIQKKFVCSTETADIYYNLSDFTTKNSLIGNLMYSKTKQQPNTIYESVILMNENNLFVLKSNGDLYNTDDIDRDQICLKYFCCKNYICVINIKAHLISKSITSFNIVISIIDSNDNRPEFINPPSFISIPESAELQSTFKLPVAVDKDSDMYGIEDYKLVDSTNTFQNIMIINEPYLKLLKPLDRETLDKYDIQLLVYDKNEHFLTNTLTLSIKVTDVNDNAPYFVQKLAGNDVQVLNLTGKYVWNISENHQGTQEIYTFHAQDNDEGDNAKITYSISSTLSHPADIVQQKFSLQSPNIDAKIILRQSLDYEVETERMISLVIVATDNGKPSKSASISLTIHVMDINDNPPVIIESNNKEISENNAAEQKLKIFTISDKDAISNKMVDCILSEDMGSKFRLEKYDWNFYGLFNNKVAFDYEARFRETVRIVCTDRAKPKIVQNVDLFVNIKDENDNVPQWNQSEYYAKIFENDKFNVKVITLLATDRDSSAFGRLYYNISGVLNGNHFHFLRIDHFSGDVFITKPIDREEYPQLEYYVTVTDNYDNNKDMSSRVVKHFNTTKLTIEIIDMNDNIPQFKGNVRHFKVFEDAQLYTKVGKLYFYDKDEYPNNVYTISLLDQDLQTQGTSNFFGIIDNNTIVVKSPLDREKISNVSLIVQAVDKGIPALTCTENIIVEILDINDNYPMISNLQNNSFISGEGIYQSTESNTLLVHIIANDLDYGCNGTLNFRILATNFSNQNDIKIDEKTGEIFTNWKTVLSPEIGIYYIHVVISDNGVPSLSTQVYFYLNVTNNNPYYSNGGYMSNIVILILIIVCSLALIVSLIAAIFWVRFRVSNDSNIICQEEYFEREHLNKEINSHQYSLMNLDKTYRQNTYEPFQGYHQDPYMQNRNHSNYANNTMHNVMNKTKMTPQCEDCLTVYGTVPNQCNKVGQNISRFRHPIIPDLNTSFNGSLMNISPMNFVLKSYCENDYKTVPNIQSSTLMVEPNFSDSGKGGSVEDLNYRQFTGVSTFTNSSFVNTSSANSKMFCQNLEAEESKLKCKSSETIF